jgi:hypothetical protein
MRLSKRENSGRNITAKNRAPKHRNRKTATAPNTNAGAVTTTSKKAE